MFNKDNTNMDSLLKFAGKKMGVSPDKLKNDLESGNLNSLNIPEAQKKQIGEILNDKEALNKILSNPNLQTLLDSITKGGK